MRLSRRLFLSTATAAAQDRALFTFAAIADIQYADKDTAGKRHYRESLGKLQECVPLVRAEQPAFTIQLGDLIDEGRENLDPIAAVYEQMPAPRYSVLGNHDLAVDRSVLLGRLKQAKAYYEFKVKGWRFVVLDGTDLNRNNAAGREMLGALQQSKAPNAQDWNGGIGPQQMEWLRATLRDAAARREPVVLFCHFPVVAESAGPDHLLWNWREVLSMIDAAPTVAAWINGHDHRGGGAVRDGVQFVTLPGFVENKARESCFFISVRSDRLELRDAAGSPVRRLPVRPITVR